MTKSDREFLAQNPDLESVQLFITDPSGVARGKTASVQELERLYTHGRPVAGSILGLDITGTDVDGTGLVWDTGDADLLCRPVPGTLSRASWLSRPTAQVMLSMYELDGRPAPADPRHVLIRAIERLRAKGLNPVVAVELEFYVLDEASGEPAGSLGRQDGRIEAYSLSRLEELAPMFDEVYAAARAQGIPAETLMSEYAPGQFELTLSHRDDALRAVDEAILLKRLLRGVAAKHGKLLTFMAKPFADLAGSGMHIHVSLADTRPDTRLDTRDLPTTVTTGVDSRATNLFASDDPAGTSLLRQALGGLKATMAESLLVFAPNGNSYRRFRSQSYAPIAASWGINNRSVSLRIPTGPASSRHLEHRIAGADANPYLVVATVLSGIERGIEQALDPGQPVVGNGYAVAQAAGARRELPATWQEAIDRAAGSEFLQGALGAEFLKIFLAIKRQECERFSAEVTELDRLWYLHSC